MSGIWYIIGSVLFNVLGQFLLKSGVANGALSHFSVSTIVKILFTPLVFSGFVAYAVSSIFWLMALSRDDLSVAYPILLALGLVLVVAISWIFLNEQMNAFRILGVLLIAIGIYFILKSA